VSQEPPKGESLLAPIANRYKPSAADFERLAAKIDASLASGAPVATTKAAARPVGLWVCLSCAAILIGGVTMHQTRDLAPVASEVVASPPSAATAEADEADDAALVESAPMPVVSIHALPTAPAAASPPAIAPKAPAAPKAAREADTLAREAKLIAAAESAFRRGDDARALVLLDEHAREFPNGLLEDERIAERIVVLCHAGQTERAAREGRAFLQNRGSDPLARRVQMSCAGPMRTNTETP